MITYTYWKSSLAFVNVKALKPKPSFLLLENIFLYVVNTGNNKADCQSEHTKNPVVISQQFLLGVISDDLFTFPSRGLPVVVIKYYAYYKVHHRIITSRQ